MSAIGSERFANFDFALDEEQEARARSLHDTSIVIDLMYQGPVGHRHFDESLVTRLQLAYEQHRSGGRVMLDAHRWTCDLAVDGALPSFEASVRASGITAAHYPMWIGTGEALLASAALLTKLVDNLDWVRKVRTADDVVEAKASGQLAYLPMCQPYEPLPRDLGLLDHAHDLGLRALMLTYNDQDLIGTGCTERVDGGISNFGSAVIDWCNQVGVIVDTAHCGRRTTLDACALSSAPVIASHTAARAVHPHDRAKDDEQLRAIAATGGVIGIVTVPFYLGDIEAVSMQTWLDHVEHVASVVGTEHISIGSDWPLAAPKWAMERWMEATAGVGFREEHGTQHALRNLPGFDDYRDLPNTTRGLVSRGFTDDEIIGIVGGNALRVLRSVLG